MKDTLPRPMVAALRFARAEIVLLAALALLTACIMAFVEVADDMTEDDGRAFDQMVLESVRVAGDPTVPIGPHWLQIAMADITALGSVTVLGIIAIVVSGFLLIKRRPMAVVTLATALLGGLAMSQTLKMVFGRERPPIEYRFAEAVNASFPSGHAMLSAVAFLTLGALLAKTLEQRRLKVYVGVTAVLLTLLVGLSRIYLGVHWASDVMAGWCIGLAWATAVWLVAWLIERWHGGEGLTLPTLKAGETPAETPRT